MAVTYEDVLAVLNPDEPDYARAAQIGPEALPHLERIIQGDDPGLALKAAHLAARIPDKRSAEVLAVAARSAEPVVRVAAASAARYLPEHSRDDLVLRFLDDDDLGVRKFGLRAVPQRPSQEVRARVARLTEAEQNPTLRELSRQITDRARDLGD